MMVRLIIQERYVMNLLCRIQEYVFSIRRMVDCLTLGITAFADPVEV